MQHMCTSICNYKENVTPQDENRKPPENSMLSPSTHNQFCEVLCLLAIQL